MPLGDPTTGQSTTVHNHRGPNRQRILKETVNKKPLFELGHFMSAFFLKSSLKSVLDTVPILFNEVT